MQMESNKQCIQKVRSHSATQCMNPREDELANNC